jgi:hypothetical protein
MEASGSASSYGRCSGILEAKRYELVLQCETLGGEIPVRVLVLRTLLALDMHKVFRDNEDACIKVALKP